MRAVGDLDIHSIGRFHATADYLGSQSAIDMTIDSSDSVPLPVSSQERLPIDISSYKPEVSGEGVWTLSELDLGTAYRRSLNIDTC